MFRPVMPFVVLLALASTASAKEVLVPQLGKQFIKPGGRNPANGTETILVKRGDTIVFNNKDSFQHNVYSLSPNNSFELKVQNPGESTPIKLDPKKFKGGEMVVECAIHPQMRIKFKID